MAANEVVVFVVVLEVHLKTSLVAHNLANSASFLSRRYLTIEQVHFSIILCKANKKHFPHINRFEHYESIFKHKLLKLSQELVPFFCLLESKDHQVMAFEIWHHQIEVRELQLSCHVPGNSEHFHIILRLILGEPLLDCLVLDVY